MSTIAIITGTLSLLFLLILHFKSPEFHPSWRMVSEYALGKHKILLTLFFLLWGLCSISTALMLFGISQTVWMITGSILVVITGVGAIMGGLFDVNHKLHGLAFGIGIPFLPIASLMIAYQLFDLDKWNSYRSFILISSHAIWISIVLMALSMMMLFAGFKKAGITWDKNSKPPEKLPEGVRAFSGYMNRLLIVCYIAWCLILSIIQQINSQ